MRKIKFIQQKKTGIFPLPPTFQQLKEEVKTLFNIKTETWSYTYFDQANDQLCVENQDDYEQFLEMNQGIETVEAKIVSDEYEEQAGAIEQDEGNIREDQDILNKSVMQETHEQIRSKKFTMHSAIYKEQKQKALSEEDLKNLVLFENSQLEHTNQVKKQQNSDHPQTNSLKGVAKVFQEKQKQELLGANPDLQAQQSKNYRIISQNSNKLPGREKFDDSSQLRDSQNHNFAINHSRKITASLQQISVRQQSHYPSPSKDHNAAQIQPLSTLSEEQQQNPCIRTTINGEKDQRASLLAELQQIKTRLKQEQDQNRQLKRQLQEAERQRKDGERQLKYFGQREVRQCVFCGRGENVGSYYNAFSDLWECVSCHKKYKIELRTGL